jgi:hypothetical protein
MWVSDVDAVFKLDSSGGIVQTIPTTPFEGGPSKPIFDGANVWISGIVIRAATGQVIASQRGGRFMAFDGSRVLGLDELGGATLWDAQSLSLIQSFDTGYVYGLGVASDGINFWLSLRSPGQSVLARY